MGAEQKHAYKKLSAAISAIPPKTPSALVPKSLPAQQDTLFILTSQVYPRHFSKGWRMLLMRISWIKSNPMEIVLLKDT